MSPAQGQLLYLVARALAARRIVEFGTSFGISTLYLAAAVRDNGGGSVIGSEIEPTKHRAATAHLAEAGLAAGADVRLGDARETRVQSGRNGFLSTTLPIATGFEYSYYFGA